MKKEYLNPDMAHFLPSIPEGVSELTLIVFHHEQEEQIRYVGQINDMHTAKGILCALEPERTNWRPKILRIFFKTVVW